MMVLQRAANVVAGFRGVNNMLVCSDDLSTENVQSPYRIRLRCGMSTRHDCLQQHVNLEFSNGNVPLEICTNGTVRSLTHRKAHFPWRMSEDVVGSYASSMCIFTNTNVHRRCPTLAAQHVPNVIRVEFAALATTNPHIQRTTFSTLTTSTLVSESVHVCTVPRNMYYLQFVFTCWFALRSTMT